MHYLYDTEIAGLGKKAEELIMRQRNWRSWLETLPKKDLVIFEENPFEIAKYLLKTSYPDPRWYLDGDIERLTLSIKKNISNMEWFHNLN